MLAVMSSMARFGRPTIAAWRIIRLRHLANYCGRYLLWLLRNAIRDHDGYTTVECGILLNLSIIFLEKVLIGL